MSQICYFCKRAPSEEQCETCKRYVCIQCSGSGNHNCYPRRAHRAISARTLLPLILPFWRLESARFALRFETATNEK